MYFCFENFTTQRIKLMFMLFILKENENSSKKSTELEGLCIFPFTSGARKKADVPY